MQNILNEEIKKIRISKEEERAMKNLASFVSKQINHRLKKFNIDASVFLGGSLAKGTLLKKQKQDIDLFIRFNKKYSEQEINLFCRKIFRWFRVPKYKIKIKKLHGSRDYYRISFKKIQVFIEVVPALRILKPEEARNITDLSYFHVNYINRQITKYKKIADEIILAKSFCHAHKCYGAESYISGFSGYALELLISEFKTFENMLKKIANSREKLILDPGKQYKNEKEILEKLNPAKTKSQIILVDPTFKERNVASALSHHTFEKFKKSAVEFLRSPSSDAFGIKKININEMKRKAYEIGGIFAVVMLKTNKQPGDIAGTKLLKFSKFLEKEIGKNFDIIEKEFEYNDWKTAEVYFILARKREIIIVGPSIDRKEAVENFKKAHPIWYMEHNKIKSSKPTDISFKTFLKKFKKTRKKTIKEMGIKKIRIA